MGHEPFPPVALQDSASHFPRLLQKRSPAPPLRVGGVRCVAIIAQLVRAPVCGTGGRGFEPHWSPHFFSFQAERGPAWPRPEMTGVHAS